MYHCVCRFVVFGVRLWLLVINTSSLSPVKNKRRRLPATSVINLPRSVVAACIALGGQTVHGTRWSQILAENRGFCLPHLHWTPPSAYCHNVWYRKTGMVWWPDGKKKLKIRLFVSPEYTNVTDTRTDRHRMTAQAALMHSIARQKYSKSSTDRQQHFKIFRINSVSGCGLAAWCRYTFINKLLCRAWMITAIKNVLCIFMVMRWEN